MNLLRLLTSVGNYLRGRALDHRLARQMHEQALAMYQQLYDGDHPDVANGLTTWPSTDAPLASLRRARELDEQALAMYQRLHEGDHPDVASEHDQPGQRPSRPWRGMGGRGSCMSRPWPCTSGYTKVTTLTWPRA